MTINPSCFRLTLPKLAVSTALSIAIIATGASSAFAHTPDSPCHGPVISTNGSSEMTVAPDSFQVQATIQSRGKSTADVSEAGDKTMAELKKKIKALNIAGLTLKTTQYNTYPVWNEKKSPDTYRNNQTLEIKLEKITDSQQLATHANKILATIGSVERVQPGGLSWYLSNGSPYERELLNDAVAQAKQRAQTLASAAGMALGDACELSYHGSNRSFRAVTQAPMMAKMEMADAAEPAPSVETGEQTLTSQVQARFLLVKP